MEHGASVNDGDLADITACVEGDEDAYARLVRRYESDIGKLMWRFCRNRGVCEELVQEVFVEAYFSLPGYRGEAPFVHWLKRIGSRVGYRYWKKRDRRKQEFSLLEGDAVVTEEGGDIEPEQAGEVLHRLLARLKEADRLVLTLMYFDDCSTREIADRMGWTRGMVKMRASRARKKIKTIAENEGLLEDLGWIR